MLEELELLRANKRLRAAGDAELAKDIVDMRLDGTDRDDHRRGDLGI
jgi:hypothetical protein